MLSSTRTNATMTHPYTSKPPPTAAKRSRKREPTQTPVEWPDLFREHDTRLLRVRLLWRRGGGRYRPLVPLTVALEDLDNASFEEWEDLEINETHFDWEQSTDGESFAERERRFTDIARDMWAAAVGWTRAKGPVCDFQLRGYGLHDEILFEDGKRCNLSGERSRYEDDPGERPGGAVDETLRRFLQEERAAWRSIEQVKDGLINKLADERSRLFDGMERASAAAPSVISNVHHLLDRAIDFHQRSVDEYISRAGGERALEAQAFVELQKTRRAESAFAFLRDGLGAVAAAVVPVITILREQGAAFTSVPDFKCAQHALAFLALTLTPRQYAEPYFVDNSYEEAMRIGESVIADFDSMSRERDEGLMLRQNAEILRQLLTGSTFRQVSTPEQKIAANFILGRLALYRMQDE